MLMELLACNGEDSAVSEADSGMRKLPCAVSDRVAGHTENKRPTVSPRSSGELVPALLASPFYLQLGAPARGAAGRPTCDVRSGRILLQKELGPFEFIHLLKATL